MAQLATQHRAVVGRSYHQGWTITWIAARIVEGTVKVAAALQAANSTSGTT